MKNGAIMYCVGIDPGTNGGIAEINIDQGIITTINMPETTKDIAVLLSRYKYRSCKVILEEQHARPSRFLNSIDPETHKNIKIPVSSGATSAWTFAQHYGEIRGILIALEIPFVEMKSKDWMKASGLRIKAKNETQTQWKNYLKSRAQEIFPRTKVTLAVADALLIANLCHRLFGRKPKPDPFEDI